MFNQVVNWQSFIPEEKKGIFLFLFIKMIVFSVKLTIFEGSYQKEEKKKIVQL